ncbi:MAG: arginase family protein, partial [Candidatus Parvarchaeota archaeon]
RNKVIMIGVRSFSLDERTEAGREGADMIFREEVEDKKKISGLLQKIRGKKVYISIDMDVFDPSIAPGVGTPQPNGLYYGEILSILRQIIGRSSLVGADVNEVRPLNDDKSTEILAAKLVQDMISMNERKLR